MNNSNKKTLPGLYKMLTTSVPIAPLVVFRIAFALMMLLALIRFAANGWIDTLFIQPKFFFTYYGFEWIQPLPGMGMYVVFAALMACAIGIGTGFLYRFSAFVFFILFTYVELIDKTNYLNHYYFISIMAGLLCLLPAHKSFSLDVRTGITKACSTVPRWAILTLQVQMALVYFFAGIAKINTDWLIHAMPLKIWLPARYDVPVIGPLLGEHWVAYLFSWVGMLFDVSIAFFLFNRRTVWYAYAVVVVFHVLTAVMFPGIGMFPFIMIVCALIFLPSSFLEKLLKPFISLTKADNNHISFPRLQTAIVAILAIHFFIQLVLPFRYTLYPGQLFYTEQGYRFSWRVMLMEKAGYAVFTVKDAATGQAVEVNNRQYLTPQQEKQMSTQPDMLLQYAKHLKEVYSKHYSQPEVYAEAYVKLNGQKNCLLVDPTVNLAAEQDGFTPKKWILAKAK